MISRSDLIQNSDCLADGADGLLAGRVALVTEAGSGIGRAVALALAGRGMRVLLIARREDAMQAVAEQVGQNSTVLPADLATEDVPSALNFIC